MSFCNMFDKIYEKKNNTLEAFVFFQSDIFESYEGVEIGLDSQSLQHIKGSTLDYKEGLMETGFSIDNPNATRTCGCGDSFS